MINHLLSPILVIIKIAVYKVTTSNFVPPIWWCQWHQLPTPTTQLSAQWQPCINFAFVNNFNTPNWLLDSGTSHHVTFDLSNISIHTPYDNSNDIVISDGMSFRTTHSSSTSLFTLSHIFYLNNVPCVPTMKNNIIFISQFCKSYNASITFSTSTFHVKDLHMGKSFCKVGLKMVCMSGWFFLLGLLL